MHLNIVISHLTMVQLERTLHKTRSYILDIMLQICMAHSLHEFPLIVIVTHSTPVNKNIIKTQKYDLHTIFACTIIMTFECLTNCVSFGCNYYS